MRLLDLGLREPYDGIPLKEVLLTARDKGLIPDTLAFYRFKRLAWVGRTGNLQKRVNVEYCRRENIPIIRGSSMGGGSLNDGNVLQYDLVSSGSLAKDDIRLAMNYTTRALQFMGLDPEITTKRNDVLLNGRKVSGTGTVVLPSGVFFSSGTLIFDFDYDLCERVLQPRDRPVSHRDWVTTLKAQLRREVPFSEVISAIKQVFETELKIEFEVSTSLTEAEEQILESLQEKYRSEEWLKTGRWSPIKDYGLR